LWDFPRTQPLQRLRIFFSSKFIKILPEDTKHKIMVMWRSIRHEKSPENKKRVKRNNRVFILVTELFGYELRHGVALYCTSFSGVKTCNLNLPLIIYYK
jgi:hypothetical protein